MVGIIIKEGESIEAALRRFKRDCANAGILSEIKKREHYEKPSLVRKKEFSLKKKESNLSYPKSITNVLTGKTQ